MSCPVKKSNDADAFNGAKSSSEGITGYFESFMKSKPNPNQIQTNDVTNKHQMKSAASQCPVKSNQTEFVYNDATSDFVFDQEKSVNQKSNLSTNRVISSIPKSDFTPDHQPPDKEKWVYPSEQQYFNAMIRKGYYPQATDVPVILAIHNLVNEQGWSKIKEWETLAGCRDPKLKQFIGRPKDLSPKARILNWMGYSMPFDRHDWIVDRNGVDIRYVIDFYAGQQNKYDKKQPPAAIAMHLDVRPALDSYRSVYDRLDYLYRWQFRPNSLPHYAAERNQITSTNSGNMNTGSNNPHHHHHNLNNITSSSNGSNANNSSAA